MSIPARVVRARAALALVALAAAASWSAATAAVALSLLQAAGAAGGARAAAAAILSSAAAVVTLWRWRQVWRVPRVALWLEERAPALQYALVTRMEPRYAGLAGALDTEIGGVPLHRPLWRAARRALIPATSALLVGIATLLLVPRAGAGVSLPRRGDPSSATAARLPAPLAGMTVRIEPPRYAGGPAQELRDPETIRGLVGSRVTLAGRSHSRDISVRLGSRALVDSGRDWHAAFVMPPAPEALRLAHEPTAAERVIVVEPIEDAPPRVVLTLPRRDTTLRSQPTSVRVAAEFADDIGLADGVIEYMISSGQEETFTARTGIVVSRQFGGPRSGRLTGDLPRTTLRLGPGDVLSIRAVAHDRNNVTGPGIGTSETRTIRIARSDEFDSLAVEAIAPVFGDSAFLSQRMILQLTEALVRVLPSLTRDSVVARSAAIARDQERLRDRVHSVVFPGHEHAEESPMAGEPPDHAEPPDPVNADLKEAYDAMWEAGRELRIASPSNAVPPMRTAAAALDRARLANRVYLRGGVPRVTVDLDRVRLTGTERGRSTTRAPRAPTDTLLRELIERLETIAVTPAMAPDVRANAISELRVRLLSVSPRAAASLANAAAAVRDGRDAAADLAAARTELAGQTTTRSTPLPWSGW